MTNNNKASLALILGTLGGLTTMALHPTGGEVSGGATTLNQFVHSLALVSQPVLLAGTLALTTRFAKERAVAVGAYILFAWASVAVMMATTMSGFIATDLLVSLTGQEGVTRDITHNALRYTTLLNHSFARIFAAFSSLAIVTWSYAMIREKIFTLSFSLYGLVSGLAVLAATITGNLSMSIHGFGAVVLAQGIWFLWLAALIREPEPNSD